MGFSESLEMLYEVANIEKEEVYLSMAGIPQQWENVISFTVQSE